MIKKSPIKKPFIFDTPQGVDHVTKTLAEDSIEKMTPFKKDQLDKLNREMKLSLLQSEEQSLKKFQNEDSSTFPSDPEQRGKLMNIQALEKSLNIRPDSWQRFVKTGALPLAEKKPDLWKDVLYKGMSPIERGQWNAEQRKKGYDGKTGNKLKNQTEIEEEKKQKRIANHTKQQWGIPDKKLVDLPIIKGNIKYQKKPDDHIAKLEHFGIENSSVKHPDYPKIDYQKIPNQDLKSKMRGWIKDADNEKKQEVINKPKSLPGVQSILAIDLPSQRFTPEITPEETQSVYQRIRNTKTEPGISTELVKLTKDINRNIDYVLGPQDQKEESRDKETTNKEKTYD